MSNKARSQHYSIHTSILLNIHIISDNILLADLLKNLVDHK